MAAPRQAHVRHEERTCKIHGRTDFARYGNGNGGQCWRCMQCDNERKKHDSFGSRKEKSKRSEPTYKMCDIHHLALPKSGICDECS